MSSEESQSLKNNFLLDLRCRSTFYDFSFPTYEQKHNGTTELRGQAVRLEETSNPRLASKYIITDSHNDKAGILTSTLDIL